MLRTAQSVANQVRAPWMAGHAQAIPSELTRFEEPNFLMTAFCRARGTRLSIAVLDINTNGCLLDLRTWPLKAGERLLIKLPELANLPAILQWVEEGRGGIVFDRPLHEAVLRHLLEKAERRRGALG